MSDIESDSCDSEFHILNADEKESFCEMFDLALDLINLADGDGNAASGAIISEKSRYMFWLYKSEDSTFEQ